MKTPRRSKHSRDDQHALWPGRPKGHWQMPSAWRAIVRQGRIAEWQVYADNEPVRALMRDSSFGGIGVKPK